MEKTLFIFIVVGSLIMSCTPTPRGHGPRGGGPGDRGADGECAEDDDCKDICEDIFKDRSDKNTCLEKLPIKQVELLEEVYDVLKEPSEDDLKRMDLDSLQVLLGVSTEPVEEAFDRIDETETKKVLTWLAKDDKAVGVIQKKDRDFKILKNLLENIDSDVDAALSDAISRGDSFIEIAADKKNDMALGWVHEFFEEDCGNSSDYNKCVFKDHYCDLSLNSEAEEYYLGYKPFDELLKEVLEEAIPSNPPSWWDDRTDIDDIDTWLGSNDVCGQADFS